MVSLTFQLGSLHGTRNQWSLYVKPPCTSQADKPEENVSFGISDYTESSYLIRPEGKEKSEQGDSLETAAGAGWREAGSPGRCRLAASEGSELPGSLRAPVLPPVPPG